MKIRLLTVDLEEVHECQTPDFKEAPGVVTWGQRVFSWKGTDDFFTGFMGMPYGQQVEEYREVFSWTVPE